MLLFQRGCINSKLMTGLQREEQPNSVKLKYLNPPLAQRDRAGDIYVPGAGFETSVAVHYLLMTQCYTSL